MGQQSSKSSPTEQKTVGSNESSLIARESDVNKELEVRPEKRRRIVEEQSMVTYGLVQGSSSNSLLTCSFDWLSSNSSIYQKILNFKGKWGRLTALRCDVLTELEHAELQPGQKRRAEVHHWLTEVQRIEDEIRSRIEDGQVTSSNLSCSIDSLIAEVDQLIESSKFSNGLVLFDPKGTILPLSQVTKPVGTNFQQNAEKIMGWIQNHHKRCIIGVYGMGGVGKTTLLTHIHDQLLKDCNFSGHVYWITVSQYCSVRRLQVDIARVLRLASFQEDDEMKRAAILQDRLAARGQTVLFLDDMWEHFLGRRVGISVDNGDCKVILSTRSYDVCRKMGCKDLIIKAEILSEGEAWNLFVEKLGHYDTLAEEAKKIARDVAKECGGLPLAIATMARSMTGVADISEWKIALNELRFARDQADMKEDVFPILRYSYDRLKEKRVQECFLSCILYGEDENIRRATLVDLWIDEGLLDEWESRDTQVAKGLSILNTLENSCLLESCLDFDKEKCVKMHDLIRDMAIMITQKDPVFMAEARKRLKQVPKEKKWRKDLVKVSLSDNEIEEIRSDMAPMAPNLTVLMLNENPLKEIPDSFFVNMRALTVLDLSQTDIERVPESVSDLENLRALLLVGCLELVYVPSVANLTKLRILDLENCCKLREAPRGLEKLERVEKLSYIPWDVSDLNGFNEVVKGLTSLISFRFLIEDPKSIEGVDYDLDFFYEDKSMWISGGEYSRILVPTSLEYLKINKSEMKGTSCLLKNLLIRKCPKMKVMFPFTDELHLPNLESIQVFSCEELEEIFASSNKATDTPSKFCLSVPKLNSLTLEDLPKIKVLFPFTEEELYLESCNAVEEIFETNKQATLLSKPNPIILSLPNFRALILRGLPKIKVIFPIKVKFHLPNLMRIEVESCNAVEEIFEANKQATPSSTLWLPSLLELRLHNLPKLESVYRHLIRPHENYFPGHEYIRGCPRLPLRKLPTGGYLTCINATFDEPAIPKSNSAFDLRLNILNNNNVNQPVACLSQSEMGNTQESTTTTMMIQLNGMLAPLSL